MDRTVRLWVCAPLALSRSNQSNKLMSTKQLLSLLKERFEEIKGEWDGDERTRDEERNQWATEGCEHVDSLLEILEALDIK